MALTKISTDGISDDAVTTDKLANAINTARDANTAKTTNATHSGEVTGATALTIADNVVDEANLKVSNSPTNGYFLSAQSGNTGGLTWAQVSTDLVADTSPQLGGDLDLNGNKISVGDGGRDANQEHIRFGNDGDLRIYHDGSNSYIEDSGTGFLIIESNQLQIKNDAADEKMIVADANGAVELYHDNSKKFETESTGVRVHGRIQLPDETGSLEVLSMGDGQDFELYHNGSNNIIYGRNNHDTLFYTNGSNRMVLQNDGHLRPSANNTYDLGTSSLRWRNIYTNDLNLSNEGGSNDVDGTWGSYTIQEGAEDLFLVNKRNGKKYKFNLTEVS